VRDRKSPGRRKPTEETLVAVLRSDAPGEAKAAAREWLRFPDSRASNVLARSNARARRRAANKRARASRKDNR
jgi:hypothetical protein